MAKPQIPEHRIVAFLVQKQLSSMAKTHVRLAVFVNVWGVGKRARHAMQIEDTAFTDVDEETDVLLAPVVVNRD